MDKVNIVKEFYDGSVAAEWERLNSHWFEFEITRRFIERYIKPGDKVLDAGGGPGRYSLYLAEKGCEVTLVDLSGGNVAFAKEKAKERGLSIRCLEGDARFIGDLVSGEFDHVLMMGPLYHLQDEADRVKAVDGCISRLKDGGKLYISFISSYAGIIFMLKDCPEMLASSPVEEEFMRLFIEDESFSGKGFTEAFFIRNRDILPFMSRFCLKKLHIFGQESILAPNEHNIMAQEKEVIDKWVDLAEKVSEREDLLSYSEHIMYIGEKVK